MSKWDMHDHTTPEQVKKNRLEGTNAEKKNSYSKDSTVSRQGSLVHLGQAMDRPALLDQTERKSLAMKE
jgi:hypothetical protein